MRNQESYNHEVMSRHTLDALTQTVLWVDKNARFFYVNKAATLNLGYSFDELLNMTVHDIDPLFPKRNWKKNFENFLSGKGLEFTSINVTKQGKEFPVEVRVSVIDFEKEKYLCAIARDISEEIKNKEELRFKEYSVRALLNASAEIALLAEPSSRIIELNRAASDFLGKSTEKLRGELAFDHMTEEVAERHREQIDQLCSLKQPMNYDITRNDRHFEIRMSPILNQQGEVEQIAIFERDVTDEQKARQILIQRENTLRALLETPVDYTILVEPDGRILEINDVAAKETGMPKERIMGMNILDILPEEGRKMRESKRDELIRSGKPVRFEDINQNNKNISSTLYPVFDSEGDISRIAIVSREITEEKRAMNELIESNEKFQSIFMNNPASIHITTIPDGVFVDVNPIFEKISGFSRTELIGNTAVEMGFYSNEEDRLALMNHLQQNGKLVDYEIPFRLRSGEVRMYSVNSAFITIQDKMHLLSMVVDITERKEYEEALRDSEKRYRLLVEKNPSILWSTRRGGETTFIGSSSEQITGYKPGEIYEMGSESWFGNIHPEDRDAVISSFEDLFANNVPLDIEYRFKTKDGRWIWLKDRSDKTEKIDEEEVAFGVAFDITNRKTAEMALKSIAVTLSGQEIYNEISKHLAASVNMDFAYVGEFLPGQNKVRVLGGYAKGSRMEPFEYDLESTPSENVIGKKICIYRSGVQKLFPKDKSLQLHGMEGYLGSPLFGRNGEAIGIVVLLDTKPIEHEFIAVDLITIFTDRLSAEMEKTRALESLLESEENFRSLSENAHDGIFIASAEAEILYANNSAVNITGYTIEEFHKSTLEKYFTGEQMRIVNQRMKDHFTGVPVTDRVVLDFLKKDGTLAPLEMAGSRTQWEGKPAVVVVFRDISERIRIEKEREQYQNALKHLVSDLVLAEERERKRIAEDLHDHMSQSLAMSKIILNNLRQETPDKKPGARLAEAVKLLDSAIDQSRSLTYELSPPVLYEFGLIPAIRWNLERIAELYNLKIEFKSEEIESRLDTDREILLYRSVNELFNNIIKHADAKQITVDIKEMKDYLYISVIDDGIGFEEQDAVNRADEGHKFGLFSIRERLESMQGKMETSSTSGKGTRIGLSVPVN